SPLAVLCLRMTAPKAREIPRSAIAARRWPPTYHGTTDNSLDRRYNVSRPQIGLSRGRRTRCQLLRSGTGVSFTESRPTASRPRRSRRRWRACNARGTSYEVLARACDLRGDGARRRGTNDGRCRAPDHAAAVRDGG